MTEGQTEPQTDDFGYGSVDDVQRQTSGGGRYLRPELDKPLQIRITSKPKYAIRHWDDRAKKFLDHTDENCRVCGKGVKNPLKRDAQWYWIVIDREDEKVKILQGPNTIARHFKDISELKDRTGALVWGNPITYDVTILKFLKSNGFTDYKVDPLPNTKRDLIEEELAKIKDADYNLEQEIENSKSSKNLGNYGGGDLETAPDESVNPDDIPKDLGEEGAKAEGENPAGPLPF